VTKIIRFSAESLAGIPSIVYGLFGFIFFVTYLKLGWSILSGGLTLAVMILPTIIRTSEEAIRTVPPMYREVSSLVGGTKWQTMTKVLIPSALPRYCHRHYPGYRALRGGDAAIILTAVRHYKCRHLCSRRPARWRCTSTSWPTRHFTGECLRHRRHPDYPHFTD